MSCVELNVALGDRSYPIFIGQGLLSKGELFTDYIPAQAVIVTNSTVAPLYLEAFKAVLIASKPGILVESVVLPDGESHKNLTTLNSIFDALLQGGFNRKTVLIALGGGVVGDMTGFAAACYQRGVPFIQVPTTLLSQVDSSVGGKTGVNHALGKNMIGAFYQPELVVIDTTVLSSLPEKELSAGLAEVIKYGLIADECFFSWLEENITKLMAKDPEALQYAIQRSCELKAEVVAEDEKESGRRAILNLGHTYGHAIEAHLGFGTWLHGEAVAVGMMMACELSQALGWLDNHITQRAKLLLQAANLPVMPPVGMTREHFEKYMKLDKKVLDGRIRLVLLQGCGNAVVTSDFDVSAFEAQLSGLG